VADNALSSVCTFMEECYDIVQVSLTDVSDQVDRASDVSLSPTMENLIHLRNLTLQDLETVRNKRSNISQCMTRSRGSVLELPNVQPKILERKGNF